MPYKDVLEGVSTVLGTQCVYFPIRDSTKSNFLPSWRSLSFPDPNHTSPHLRPSQALPRDSANLANIRTHLLQRNRLW